MPENDWDVAVIGGGAGGVAAAIRSRQLGAETVIIEAEDFGGVCMNRGCIPTKLLMGTAALFKTIQSAQRYGISVSEPRIDWDALMARKNDTVGYLRLGTEAILRSNGVEMVRGKARFQSPHALQVEDRRIEAKAMIIATGSCWSAPDIPGIGEPGVITPDDVLCMRAVPDSVAVVGSGPVELEMAQYFLLLGSRVTLLERESRPLKAEDREMVGRLTSALKKQGMTIQTNTTLMEIIKQSNGLELRLEDKKGTRKLTCEKLGYASRRPNLQGLNLDAAGVAWTPRGISVDDHVRTSASHIFAIGDATGDPMYSHRASAMGIAAAENALGRTNLLRQKTIPRAYYTLPEIASVGLTEAEAKKKGFDVTVGAIPYGTNPRALMMLETDGAVKVITEARYGEILGISIVGPGASELIGEGVLAMETQATVEDLARAVRLHPSLSEAQVEAGREALGWGINVLRR